MRMNKVKSLSLRVIDAICDEGVTPEEIATTFDMVFDAINRLIVTETLDKLLKRSDVVGEAEEILKEAFGDVDKQSRG